jgi:hypothetical protein
LGEAYTTGTERSTGFKLSLPAYDASDEQRGDVRACHEQNEQRPGDTCVQR